MKLPKDYTLVKNKYFNLPSGEVIFLVLPHRSNIERYCSIYVVKTEDDCGFRVGDFFADEDREKWTEI